MLNQIRIGQRLQLGFGLLLAILVLLAVTAALRITAVAATVNRVVTVGDEGTTTGLMRAAVNSQIGLLKDLALAAGPDEIAAVNRRLTEEQAKYGTSSRHLDQLFADLAATPEQTAMLAEVRELAGAGAPAVERMLALAQSGEGRLRQIGQQRR